ncbi:ribosomal RNA processing protein 1 homolog A isoform X3 [Tamandua tetradactyla]
MWMQDKPLLQEELGRTISQLIHAFQTTEAQHLFLQTFWQTMCREWMGIDRLRLDKFYMILKAATQTLGSEEAALGRKGQNCLPGETRLQGRVPRPVLRHVRGRAAELMRMVLNESLKALKTHGWDERQMEKLLKLLTTEILHPDSQAPNGVKSHFIEIFLEELTKVGAQELTADQNLKFIDPFCRIAARTKDTLVLHNIAQGIFETIVEQAPFAIEDLMNELDAQEEEEEEMLEGDSCDSDEPLEESPGKLPRGSIGRTEPEARDKVVGDSGDSTGAVLQFDYEAVANRLFEMASRPNTPSQNRKRLYKVVRKLQELAEGHFPEDDVPEKVYRHLHEGRLERKKKKRRPKPQLRNKKGKGEEEDTSPDLSSRKKRRRRKGRRADPTGQPRTDRDPGARGARWRRP